MGKRRNPLENLEELVGRKRKKFVRYHEGAALYSMGLHSFQDLAKEAKAIYRVKRMVLVNLDILDDYLESFREED